MTFIVAWIAFPVLLAALGVGWGVLVEWGAGVRVGGALLVPVGLAAALVVAALLTTNGVTAPLAAPVVAVLAAGGLVLHFRSGTGWPRSGWPAVAAIAVLVAYGAPVLATGTATLTGFVKLDDTATWLGITAHLFSAGRSTAGLDPSTYKLVLDVNLGSGAYPVGSFMLLGVGRALTGVDAAWVYQPYLACCGAALALCLYTLIEPLCPSPRVRAAVVFVAAQPALLYGYSLWGGIKELTAAFLVALVAALAARVIRERPADRRALLPLAIATAALIVTFGPGTAVWVVPGLGVVVVAWVLAARRQGSGVTDAARSAGWLAAGVVVLSVPVWIVLSRALRADSGFVSGAAAASRAIRLGNLHAPLSAFEAAGIWPVGDFRDSLGSGFLPYVLIGVVLAAGLTGLWWSLRARAAELGQYVGVALYAGVALVGCLAIAVAGGVPWVVAKGLAIASPAVLLAGLAGGLMLWARNRPAGAVVLGLIAAGVVWSNVLGYHDATIAPVGPLQDLAHIGTLVGGQGPTFVNDDSVYADHYFLRAGDPVEPADLRSVVLPLKSGTVLSDPAIADLDSFALSTVMPYRSIVTRRSPAESRPSSIYRLVWAGRYYELWERPAKPTTRVLQHVAFGDSGTIPYCGLKQNLQGRQSPLQPICSVQPVATATCKQVRSIAQYATSHGAELVAAERSPNIYARGDQLDIPRTWYTDPEAHSIAPHGPGSASLRVKLTTPESYELWLGGSLGRGFEVELDGRRIGRVSNQLSVINAFDQVADVSLSVGIHTITLIYPKAGIQPGGGDYLLSDLTAVVLAPITDPSGPLTTVSARNATSLCGKSVDWIEVVAPATP